MAILYWPAADRLREKLLSKGAQALSEAELLAIFHAHRGQRPERP